MYRILTKRLSLRQDFIITLLNALGLIAGTFFLNGYISRKMGLEVLGEYLLIRRTGYALIGVFLVGMNVGLPNFIARDEHDNYGDAGFLFFMFATIPMILLISLLLNLNVIPGFGSRKGLVYFVYFTGISIQYLVYALFRGKMNMIGANLIQLFLSIFIPVFLFLLLNDLDKTLSLIGAGMILLGISVYLIRNHGIRWTQSIWGRIFKLARFGIERVPGFLSQFFLLAGVPILLASHVSYTELSFLNSSISLVRILLIFIGPLGILLLPRMSKALSEKRHKEVKTGLELLIKWALFFSIIFAFALSLEGPNILSLWLGSVSIDGEWIATYIMVVIPFYALIGILRSPIDAASIRGLNSLVHMCGALAVFATYFGLLKLGIAPIKTGVISFIIGYIISSIASLWVVKKLLSIKVEQILPFWSLLMNVVFMYVIHQLLNHFILINWLRLLLFFSLTGVGLIVFIFFSSSHWVLVFRKQVLGSK